MIFSPFAEASDCSGPYLSIQVLIGTLSVLLEVFCDLDDQYCHNIDQRLPVRVDVLIYGGHFTCFAANCPIVIVRPEYN